MENVDEAMKEGNMSAEDTKQEDCATQECSEAHRYTYREALQGKVPVPRGDNGATLFKVLMVGGMVTFMVTVNGIRHTGFEFLAQSHWLYPLMFCIAFLVRTYIGDTLVGAIAPRTVLKLHEGVVRNVAMTALNVLCMAPVMCSIATLLLKGTQDFLISYITTLPIVMPIGFTVNFFVVGPAVKLLFNNRISPAGGMRFLQTMRANTDALTRLLGF